MRVIGPIVRIGEPLLTTCAAAGALIGVVSSVGPVHEAVRAAAAAGGHP